MEKPLQAGSPYFCLELPQMLTLPVFCPTKLNTTHWFPGVGGDGWTGDGQWEEPHREMITLFFVSRNEYSRFCNNPRNCPPKHWMTMVPHGHDCWLPPGRGRLPALWTPHSQAPALVWHLLPGSLLIMPACFKRAVGHRDGGVLETFN